MTLQGSKWCITCPSYVNCNLLLFIASIWDGEANLCPSNTDEESPSTYRDKKKHFILMHKVLSRCRTESKTSFFYISNPSDGTTPLGLKTQDQQSWRQSHLVVKFWTKDLTYLLDQMTVCVELRILLVYLP